jgi:cell division protein FtsI/penicillin-binding protein 2
MKRIKHKIQAHAHKLRHHPHVKKHGKTIGLPLLIIFLFLGIVVPVNRWYQRKSLEKFPLSDRQLLSAQWLDLEKVLQNAFEMESPYWPAQLYSAGEYYNINYTFDLDLTQYLKNLISQHQSDYTSIVVVDNETGHILSALDHERKTNIFDKKITFSATSPAASLFKVITAADVIQHRNVSSLTPFSFWGRKTTLYRTQLQEQKRERQVPFKQAFAESNNVVFGKAALKYSDSLSLLKTAESFGFNRTVIDFLNMGKSFFPIAENEYNLAELASGLNTVTMISPVHAAKMAAIVANGGKDLNLKIVKSLSLQSNQAELFPPDLHESHQKVVISPDTNEELKVMMRGAIENGTAKMIRKKMNRKLYERLEMGGKTGQMTGGIPQGKRDWFIMYVYPKDGSSKGVSIAIMLVNQQHWYVRSVFMAMKIIEHLYAERPARS